MLPLQAAIRKKAFLFEKAGLREAPGHQVRGNRARNFLEDFSCGAASLASRAAFLFMLPWSRSIFREGACLSSPEFTALRQESSLH